MSYDIYIGEAVLACEDGERRVVVQRVTNPDAPCWEDAPGLGGYDASEKSNGRHPGYSQMDDFCKKAGIHEMFFDAEDGILREHPGIVALTKDHVKKISAAKKKWVKNRGTGVPGWDEKKGHDSILARLIWYEFWFKWAIATCKNPSIQNT